MVTANGSPDEPKKPKLKHEGEAGYREVFTRFITLKNGRILYAEECGKTVFHFWVKDSGKN